MILDWLEDAARHGSGRMAVVQRDAYLSVRGLLHRSERRARELKALGVGPGHVVGVMLGNVTDAVVATVATFRLGAAVLLLPPLTTARELGQAQAALPLRALIARPGAKAFGEPGRSYAGDAAGPRATHRSRLSGSLLTVAIFPETDAPALPAGTLLLHALPGVSPDGTPDYAFVARTAPEIRAEAEHLAAALRLGTGLQERLVAGVALEQPFQLELVLAAMCGYGVSLHMEDDLSPRALYTSLRQGSPALALLTRAGLAALASLPALRPLPEQTRLVCVDGPVTAAVARPAAERLKVRPEGALHLPETGLLAADASGRSPQSAGLPPPGVSLQVLGARGAPIGAGRPGDLRARSEAISKVVLGRKGALAGDGGWVSTGWRARFDRKGRVRPLERTDDRVLTAGLPVSLREIEAVLRAHPAVRDARSRRLEVDTTTEPGTRGGLAAEVVLGRRVRPETLATHCERLLAPHKVPTQIQVVSCIER